MPVIRSLGYRTDLSLLQIQGSTIEPEDGTLGVRTPDLPSFHWGNFLLLSEMPATDRIEYWLDRFERTFPGANHVAFGIDDPHCPVRPGVQQFGLTLSQDTVLTTASTPVPPHPNTDVEYRELRSDADWNALFDLRVAIDGSASIEHQEFLHGRVRAHRRLDRNSTAAWWGAFDGGHLIASLGIALAGEGIARYQNVGTHPDHRRRGLAASLVARAGAQARADFGARSLVIVAEADSAAERIYRSTGFSPVETSVGIERV
ncbi:MAG TPA: GNAT family N-acetyltransferase [Mycobacteriales bacterium]|nr:GNAT family N-acetyltransferase [Mycobacteriales bacterium]